MIQSDTARLRRPPPRSEQSLRSASDDTFEAIVQEVTDYCIFLLDPEGMVVSWNKGAEMLKGYPASEVIGHHFSCFYPGEDVVSGKPQHALAAAAMTGRYRDEGWRVRRDGSRFWADVVITALHDADGGVRGFAKVTRDVTERRRAMQELVRSREELAEFAQVAAHDLQEPLRMVVSYVQLLQRRAAGRLGQEEDEYIQLAVDGATRMQALIADLLGFSLAGRKPLDLGRVRVSGSVEVAIQNLAPSIAATGAEIACGELPEIAADPEQLAQLFQNLIGNSLKFHGESPPRITVGARPAGSQWLFSVGDNGIGIPADQLQRVFEPFKRLHGREQFAGTGIGLAICKKVVDRHGGCIWAESEPGQGATFHFTLPAAGPAASQR